MQPEIRKASLGSVFLKVALLVAWIWFRLDSAPDTYDVNRATERLKKLAELNKTEQAKLTGFAWADKTKGLVRLPIGQAMQQEAIMLQAKPAKASAVKVDNPYPTGLANLKLDNEPAAAASASPAASPSPAASAQP
jgi:hypothetical protein